MEHKVSLNSIDATINFAMALSWEEGLLEIDSFYSSPPDPTQVNGETHASEDVQRDTTDHTEGPLPSTSASDDTSDPEPATDEVNDTVRHSEEKPSPVPRDPTPTSDEFATLMKDIDQVTASEAEQANPKAQLHYILSDISAPATEKDAGPTEDRHNDKVTHHTLPWRGNLPPVSAFAPQPRPKNLADRDLPLLWPRRAQALDLLPASTGLLPEQQEPGPSPSHSGDLRTHKNLALLASRPLTPDQSPTPDVLMTPQLSPDMPSSGDKSSLIEEMRSEENDRRSKLSSRIAAPVFKHQPVTGLLNAAGHSSPRDLLKHAEMAQQKAEAVRFRIRNDVPHITGQAEGEETESDDDESASFAGESPKSKKQITSLWKRPNVPKASTNTRLSPQKIAVPQRRSTRHQQPKQDSEKAFDPSEDKATNAPVVVPKKRKNQTTGTAGENKKRKTRSQAMTEPAREETVGTTHKEASTFSQRLAKNAVTQREVKSISWGILAADVSPGARKTKAQKEKEVKKQPNAGRAVKARHAGKGT